MYLIQRTDQGGGFLGFAPGLTGEAYTHKLERARVFPTREAAERERCVENEIVVGLETVFHGYLR